MYSNVSGKFPYLAANYPVSIAKPVFTQAAMVTDCILTGLLRFSATVSYSLRARSSRSMMSRLSLRLLIWKRFGPTARVYPAPCKRHRTLASTTGYRPYSSLAPMRIISTFVADRLYLGNPNFTRPMRKLHLYSTLSIITNLGLATNKSTVHWLLSLGLPSTEQICRIVSCSDHIILPTRWSFRLTAMVASSLSREAWTPARQVSVTEAAVLYFPTKLRDSLTASISCLRILHVPTCRQRH